MELKSGCRFYGRWIGSNIREPPLGRRFDRAKTGLHANTNEVDAALVGRKVELVFDPFDLTTIEVRWHGRSMGPAVPHKIGRHVHAKARPDDTTPPTPTPTGIDYLHLVEAQHTAELAERVQYSRLHDEQMPDEHVPGQLQLPGTKDTSEDTSDDNGGVSA